MVGEVEFPASPPSWVDRWRELDRESLGVLVELVKLSGERSVPPFGSFRPVALRVVDRFEGVCFDLRLELHLRALWFRFWSEPVGDLVFIPGTFDRRWAVFSGDLSGGRAAA